MCVLLLGKATDLKEPTHDQVDATSCIAKTVYHIVHSIYDLEKIDDMYEDDEEEKMTAKSAMASMSAMSTMAPHMDATAHTTAAK